MPCYSKKIRNINRNTLLTVLFLFSISVFAQNSLNDSIDEGDKKIDFKVMPYVSYDRNLEFMIGAIPLMMYRLNPESYFICLFNRMYFNEDKWRLTFFGLNGNLNSQFFLDHLDATGYYDYSTIATVLSAGIQRKILNDLYLGLNYSFSDFETDFQGDILQTSRVQFNILDLSLMHDSRNTIYYPTEGSKIKLKWLYQPEWFGNEVEANIIRLEYNKYLGFRDNKDVLALRYYGGFGLGDIAFQQQETIGGKDIRGYSEGTYRGDGLMALQGEYRYNFHPKLGMVAFAGLATIYGSINEDFNWNMYPGIGTGFRYMAFEDVKFNIGLDVAVGKEDWGIYFRIGEAF